VTDGESRDPLPSGVASAGVRALTLVGKFVLVLFLARFYPAEELGLYGLIVSAMGIATFALGFEFHYFTIRALIGRSADARAALLRDQAVLHATALLVVVPVFALASFGGFWTPVPQQIVFWFCALLVVELASQEAGIALIALSKPFLANVVLFVRTAVWVVPVALLYLAGARDIDVVFLAWFTGALLSLVIAAWGLRGMGWRNAIARPVDWALIRAGLRVAAPFIVTTGASMGLLFVDRFIIAANMGLGPVGVYVFFAGITTALHTLINTGVSLVRMPTLIRAHQLADHRRFTRELVGMGRLTVISALSLAAVAAVAINPLLRIVDRELYEHNVDAFLLLLSAAVLRCIADVPIYALYARHRDRTLLGVNVAAFLTVLLADITLVPRLGLAGAGLAAGLGAFALLAAALSALVRSPTAQPGDFTPPRSAL